MKFLLCDKWNSVIVLCAFLQDSMPVNCHFHALHMIFNIDDDSVSFTNLNTWSGNHTINCENTTFDAISEHALAMTPYGVGCIWCTDLTGTVMNRTKEKRME